MCKEEMRKKIKEYGYDSLCLRYKNARDAQAEYEAKVLNKISLNQAIMNARKDESKFFSILTDLIGEHD